MLSCHEIVLLRHSIFCLSERLDVTKRINYYEKYSTKSDEIEIEFEGYGS